jgi:adenylylsulfate kinase
MGTNTVRQFFGVNRSMRAKQKKHNAFLIWFTGLSGAGKSTIANELELILHQEGIATYLLDGDNIRQGLNKDLSFSDEGRSENLRRVAEVAGLMIDSGTVVLAAFIAPGREDRARIRDIVGKENYVEIYVSTPLEVCEGRDVKGLYKKARKGEINYFTGISSPYEIPEHPDLSINTAMTEAHEAAQMIRTYIIPKLRVNE